MSTRDEYEAQKVLNCSTLNRQAHITGAFCEPAINYHTRLNKDSRWQVRLYQKSYIISVISPPVDYQASSRLTQWVVTWKKSDILPLCFVSAPRASMFYTGTLAGGIMVEVKFLGNFSFQFQNVPSIWKYITLLNVIQDLVNKVNRQHLLFLNIINIM